MDIRRRSWQAVCVGILACVSLQTASAADCPGNPDALGTSRTLAVDPLQYPLIGAMQYKKTLPLADHEVVLTFDDGPLPRYSNQVLAILAAQCVKATFFLVGRQANANPEGVRKVRDGGHTVATHTQNHPLGMYRLPIDRASKEIDDGIASVTAALGDGSSPVPFFRIPGLSRADEIEKYATSRGLQVWSADFLADDWRNISSARVYDLAIRRLEARKKGILLLHDIQPRTVAALPKILHELKARGYRIVHVVPATSELPATPSEPQQWQLRPAPEMIAVSQWPPIPNFVFTATEGLPGPGLADLDWRDDGPADRPRRARGIPLPRPAFWPQLTPAHVSAESALPVPAASIFQVPEATRVMMMSAPAPRATKGPDSLESRGARQASARARPAAAHRPPLARNVAHQIPAVTHHGQTAPKPASRAKRNGRPVRVASDR